jgi:hypothetical protein
MVLIAPSEFIFICFLIQKFLTIFGILFPVIATGGDDDADGS